MIFPTHGVRFPAANINESLGHCSSLGGLRVAGGVISSWCLPLLRQELGNRRTDFDGPEDSGHVATA
jgi:hypothetical protein